MEQRVEANTVSYIGKLMGFDKRVCEQSIDYVMNKK